MKKALAAVFSVLLLIVVIAIAYKLAAPQTQVEPDDDMLVINELAGGMSSGGASVRDSGDISQPAPGDEPELSPIMIDAQNDNSPAPTPELKPELTPEPTPEPTPELTPELTPGPTAARAVSKPLDGLVIGVDPGHQAKSNKETEPVAPGSSVMKAKVSSGTAGKFTGVAEHVVNLNVGLHLKELLEDAGATVVMTRETADVNISNVERAKLFNVNNVDLGVRLHCNGSTDESVRGAFMLVPKDKNYPFYDECVKAAKAILEAYGKKTGIGIKKGITYRDDQTGFNWCERVIVNIEMGHMSNKEEDELITDKDFQKKMAQGVYEGIVDYFND